MTDNTGDYVDELRRLNRHAEADKLDQEMRLITEPNMPPSYLERTVPERSALQKLSATLTQHAPDAIQRTPDDLILEVKIRDGVIRSIQTLPPNSPLPDGVYVMTAKQSSTQDLAARPISPKPFEIDWSEAPAWANYHTFNEDGSGWWWSHRPRIYYGKCFWENGSYVENANSESSGRQLPPDTDWKLTLVRRS